MCEADIEARCDACSTCEPAPKPRPERIRAICLLSGGLDSRLALCVVRDQGIEVCGLCFESPFFSADAGREAAAALDVPIDVRDFSADIVGLLTHPPHGFGAGMNPCIDCHARMIRRAGELMESDGFHFIVTGEVLNERPMSQNARALRTVARESGFDGFVVRPLSAALLPETVPERNGWIDRKKLLGLHGRSRGEQFALAARYGLKDYPTPAGGCRLTDPNFAQRLRDLRDHEGLNGVRSIELLRVGRHFRLDRDTKLIVGRNQEDNIRIEAAAELYDLILKVEGITGPTGLLPVNARPEHVRLAAAICARYSDTPRDAPVQVRVWGPRDTSRIEVLPASQDELEKLRI